jgi:hypothetical protein
MRALVLIGCLCGALVSSGDVAKSLDYEMTIATIEGGGGRSRSADYINDLAIVPVAGRSVASQSVAINFGYAAELNNPPIVGDDVGSHPQGEAVDILNAALLGNDFDIDRDKLRVHSVSAVSEAGGAVTVSSSNVHYAPPAGFAGTDWFSYRVADTGGDLATARVTMYVAPLVTTQAINTIALIEQADGTILLRYRQNPGRTAYIVEYTDDLAVDDWQTLTVESAGADGVVEVLIDPSQSPQGFYRAVVF